MGQSHSECGVRSDSGRSTKGESVDGNSTCQVKTLSEDPWGFPGLDAIFESDQKEPLSQADQRPPLEGGWLAGTPRAGSDTAKQFVPVRAIQQPKMLPGPRAPSPACRYSTGSPSKHSLHCSLFLTGPGRPAQLQRVDAPTASQG